MIFDHTHPAYIEKRDSIGVHRWNGAYYYSKEICDLIIPNVQTDRNWVTVNIDGHCWDHSIVFCHNNRNPRRYEWLKDYKDLILVCNLPETAEAVKHLGKTILLPLSIDVQEVEQYKRKRKTKDVCFVGRQIKASWGSVPEGTDFLCGVPREELLKELAKYKRAYAIARCAIEAQVLGCEVLPYDPRFPDPSIWGVLDSREAAKMLQEELDRIEGEH